MTGSTVVSKGEARTDVMFLDAVIDAHARGIASDPTPRFLYALTNFNHGPHDRQLVPSGHFGIASFPDAGYVEYYTRLAETASVWQRLRAKLASSFPGRPVLIVHHGDHQPVLTK
ncbi:hypothetical protein NLM31_39945 [Bradyrhizobium sp. CCGUVB4N]|uniref:hypothetical protein n=1 Tax=Bradyrhizobium sp. CCGUVB4N TaxID=2949631 RepID=UPI0020B41D7F|nr:hypothetical protein [Bradyrhizobium sp. CCGUVB4N]MCP3386573.1 hypothetical protein [Bradyrhizobium sp. CCGUVB4N]